MNNAQQFEAKVLPFLDAGYNLARWLLNDASAADDVVQEASLRAYKYFYSLKAGQQARPWFLGIVRNACFTYLRERKDRQEQFGLEDDALDAEQWKLGNAAPDALQVLEQERDREAIDAAIRALPAAMRDVFVLRELEGLEYNEIAQIANLPVGTVMSRLSRARQRLRLILSPTDVNE
jgi:RNA polymerase sigma factor (sigma-70 family)